MLVYNLLLLTWWSKGYDDNDYNLNLSTDVLSFAGDVVAEHCAPPPPQSSSIPAAPAAPASTHEAAAGKTSGPGPYLL